VAIASQDERGQIRGLLDELLALHQPLHQAAKKRTVMEKRAKACGVEQPAASSCGKLTKELHTAGMSRRLGALSHLTISAGLVLSVYWHWFNAHWI
jgi:hypothetical protein